MSKYVKIKIKSLSLVFATYFEMLPEHDHPLKTEK